MNKQPNLTEKWVNNLPAPNSNSGLHKPASNTVPRHISSSPIHNIRLLSKWGRDFSLQSDDSSHCSSLESVLELRKADPEAVLIGLGFGPPYNARLTHRIPQRFLHQSKLLTNIDFNKFLEDYGEIGYSGPIINSSPPTSARSKPKPS